MWTTEYTGIADATPEAPLDLEKFYAAVTAAMKQGSPTKQRLAAWAIGSGGARGRAAGPGQASGTGWQTKSCCPSSARGWG